MKLNISKVLWITLNYGQDSVSVDRSLFHTHSHTHLQTVQRKEIKRPPPHMDFKMATPLVENTSLSIIGMCTEPSPQILIS